MRVLPGLIGLALLWNTACVGTPAPVARPEPALLPTATPFYQPSPVPTRPLRSGTPQLPTLLPPSDVRPPDPRLPGQPTASDLQIRKANFVQCRNPAADEFWGGWMVALNNREFFLARGRAEAVAWDAAGNEIGRAAVRDFAIASSIAADWIVPAEILERPSRTPLRWPAGQVARFDLEFTGPLEWAKVSPASRRVRWVTEVERHVVGEGSYPEHRLWVRVRNTGAGALAGASLFAFIYDSAGRLVDMVSSDGENIAEGETRVLEARSLASDDRCRGSRDPAGYQADYWLSFWSSNQLYAQLQSVVLP